MIGNSSSQANKGYRFPPINSLVDQVSFLQRTVGNREAERFLKSKGIQAQLAPGQSLANSGLQSSSTALRTGPFIETGLKTGQPNHPGNVASGEISTLPSFVQEVLRSPGLSLDPATRAFMEPRFGKDFGHVRLHTDAKAAESAREVNALAYTVGRDVVFAHGRYQPNAKEGRKLLAHELTHTIQQRSFTSAAISPHQPISIEPLGSSFEQAAEERSARLTNSPAALDLSHRIALQRQVAPQPEIEMSREWAFAADKRKRTWRHYARSLGNTDATRIRKKGKLTPEDHEEVNAKLRFFEGDAIWAYIEEVKPALIEVTREEIAMPMESARAVTESKETESVPGIGVHEDFFKRMLAHENYIDNNIQKVEFFTAELARIHYKDGYSFELGLSPQWMKAPFVEVDYHTPREDLRPIFDAKGNVSFFREADLANVPRSMPYGEMLKTYAHPVQFVVGPGVGGRIVPTRVNMLTAPTLCRVLLDSERRYEENVHVAVQVGLGGTRAIGPYAGVGGIPKPLGGLGTATITRAALSAEAKTLAREMDSLLAKGGTKTITVKEVELVDVAVSMQGNVLNVKRFMSHLPEHLRGKGTGMEVTAAFEQAAAEIGRLNGAKKVMIDVGVIINPAWRALLEARGYVHFVTEGRWVKTITL
jgi:hypothetical protein